jgi:hypothetical protein
VALGVASLGGRGEHCRRGRVRPFQCLKPELGRRIGMLQRIDELLGSIVIERLFD